MNAREKRDRKAEQMNDFPLNCRVHIGDKPELVSSGRLDEARRLTTLMEKRTGGFSYVRLGDKDVAFLINPVQTVEAFGSVGTIVRGTEAHGTPGLLASQHARLRGAFEKASYVDYWDMQWRDESVLDALPLNRCEKLQRNTSRATSFILPTWLEVEFKGFCKNKKVLFSGAEAPLLQVLSRKREFLDAASGFWPTDANLYYHRPLHNGRNPGAHLELIKSDLKKVIERDKIDTVFISLGGVAKILCQELADELGICAIDFGAGMRALSYSGSGGYMSARATHSLFMYRLPYPLYMQSLVEAFPTLENEEILAKAHAQLILELQKKEVGWTHPACELDISEDNLRYFSAGLREYHRLLNRLGKKSEKARKERADFLHFCGKHRLSLEGRAFYLWLLLKGLLKGQLEGFQR
jgi:hypothetical protein